MKKLVPLSAAIVLALGGTQIYAGQLQLARGDSASKQSFDQVDTNKDGQISRTEATAAGLNVDWSRSDSDGDGALSRTEYDSAMKSEGSSGGSSSGGTSGGSTGGGMSQ
jgi:hypothetical protein